MLFQIMLFILYTFKWHPDLCIHIYKCIIFKLFIYNYSYLFIIYTYLIN
jgi:hypothetical protein